MDNNDTNEFEKIPGKKIEAVGERELAPEEDFSKSFETGVPEFAGNQFGETQFGQATSENLYYGEAKDDEGEVGRDESISEAGKILDLINNIKMDEGRLRIIYEFDADGAEQPALELAKLLGVLAGDKPRNSIGEYELDKSENKPVDMEHSRESEIYAIKKMQKLIGEILTADKDYSELRMSRHGVVGQAAIENEERGVEADRAANLAEILQGWAEYKKRKKEVGLVDDDYKQDEVTETTIESNNDQEKRMKINEGGVLEEKEKQDNDLNPEILQKQI